MSLIVYDKTDTSFSEIKEYSFFGQHLGERKITATVYSPNKISFDIGDYVTYRGEKFEIYADPILVKTAETGLNIGNALKYTLEFHGQYRKLQDILFQDYVSSDDTEQYYTGETTFTFFNNVNEMAIRMQANLDRHSGLGIWTVSVDSSVVLEEKQISLSNNYIWDALGMVQSVYELDFYIDGFSIQLGGAGANITQEFSYGKNNGLYELQRTPVSNEKIITRLKTYGASRNLPVDYLRDEYAKGRYFTKLMLPNFATTDIDYVDAPASVTDKYGIIEGSKTFEDVYPSIEEVDLGLGRIDEIVSVDTIDLDSDYFTIKTRDLEFDINDYLTAETPRISIKGSNADSSPTYLGGYEFEIVEADGNNIRLLKNQADNNILPDDVTTVRAGDRFVLLGIEMPEVYITNAENKLLTRANEYFSEGLGIDLEYVVKFDEKFITENDLSEYLVDGNKVKINDVDLEISSYITIQSVTIKYSEKPLPEYEVKLSNINAKTTLSEFKDSEIYQNIVNSVSNNSTANTRVNNNVTVRKVEEDITWQ